MTYRIMSFDGGGIRGVYTAQLLAMLSKESGFLKNVDVFVGTSAGSFLALALSCSMLPDQLIEFYHHFAKLIFVPDSRYDPSSELCPKYQNTPLKELMQKYVFPTNPSLIDLPKKVVIPAFKLYNEALSRWAPHYFHNFEKEEGSHKVIDVALASGAAPIFFPSYQGYVDGGIFANNPSMVGLCQALEKDKNLPKLEEVRLFSIGTGLQPISITQDIAWGAKEWCESSSSCSFFSMVTEGGIDVAHEQCKQILKERYHRLNTVLDKIVTIDSWEEIPYLIDAAQRIPKQHPKLWEETFRWIEKSF